MQVNKNSGIVQQFKPNFFGRGGTVNVGGVKYSYKGKGNKTEVSAAVTKFIQLMGDQKLESKMSIDKFKFSPVDKKSLSSRLNKIGAVLKKNTRKKFSS